MDTIAKPTADIMKIEKGTIGAGWFSIDSFTFDNKMKTSDWSELG